MPIHQVYKKKRVIKETGELIKKRGYSLAYKNELTAVENKIPDVGNLVEKTDLSSKITEIKNKIPDVSN